MKPEQIRKRVIMFLNAILRERVSLQESLCQKLPQYSKTTILPDGTESDGGLLEDLKVLKYAMQPNPDHPDTKERNKTLIDELSDRHGVVDFAAMATTGSDCNLVITEVPWQPSA